LGILIHHGRRCLYRLAVLAAALTLAWVALPVSSAQTIPQQSPAPSSAVNETTQGGRIHGSAKLGTIPLGGVIVLATNSRSRKKFTATTDGTGTYSLAVPEYGAYSIRAVFRALTTSEKKIVFTAASQEVQIDFRFDGSAAANSLASLWPALILPPVSVNTIALQPAESTTGGNSGAQFPTFTGDPNFSGDTFVVNGRPSVVIPYFQMADQMRQDFEDGHELQSPSMQPDQVVSVESATSDANPASTRIASTPKTNQLHGEFFWNGGDSGLNARPYVLAGTPPPNPSYYSNSYGATLGGPAFIPGLTKPSPRDFVLLSFSGQLSTSLIDLYGVVPTDLERQGNFSQLLGPTGELVPIYPPKSTVPYPNNIINTPLDPAALALLKYIPGANLQSTGLNYRLLTTQGTHTNTLGVSYTHNFGKVANAQSSSASQLPNAGQSPTQSFNVNFNFGDVATDVVNIFPQLGGKQRLQGYSLTAGYTVNKGEWITSLNVNSSRNNSQVRNPFTNGQDIATNLGLYADYTLAPINTNPQNYGLPNLVFNNFTGLSETQPNFQLTQTTSVSGLSYWSHGSHIVRFGGDLHRIDFNFFGGTDATGTYIFTGFYTQVAGSSNVNPVAPTGSSFADFLVGVPQETKIEAPIQTAYTRQTNWDLFIRDDWRIFPNLTICAGLRYDYFSPFVEKYNRLSTLDYNSDFSEVQPVQPNGIGPVSGTAYPRSLIHPDRNNFSPHLGIAWQANRHTAIRAAYGINYTVAQYGSFIQNLAYQPPFANVQINGNVPNFATPYSLQFGFGNGADDGNYAINKNYRLPYIQVWYLDVQQELPLDIVLDVGYTGSKGTRLDVISAPGFINSTPFASAFFDFEDSNAFSKFNALVVRASRRFRNGLALQAIYTYSHSIDDASSILAGTAVVAQNWQDIPSETGNSSFDTRHQITGSFLYQLPFGPNKPYLHQGNWASRIFGHWSVAGFFTLATGFPLTPYVSAAVTEVERGTHGSVRPDLVPGASITAGGGQLDHWFNTAAFSTDFAPNQFFGNASRYSIPGPGVQNVNISISKIFNFRETRSVELRATANNAFNIVQYAGVNTQVGSSTFGYVNAVQPMRQLTFLARFRF
jgi:trimeric autotransporter adhesin